MSNNQCMGCQAGWPLVTRTSFRGAHTYEVHEVVGGYPHEIVSCTRSHYTATCLYPGCDEEATTLPDLRWCRDCHLQYVVDGYRVRCRTDEEAARVVRMGLRVVVERSIEDIEREKQEEP